MTIKILVYVLAVFFGFSVLGGVFNWDTSGVDMFLGFVDIVAIVWLVVLVSGKDYKSNK